jgi:hypothetical protein
MSGNEIPTDDPGSQNQEACVIRGEQVHLYGLGQGNNLRCRFPNQQIEDEMACTREEQPSGEQVHCCQLPKGGAEVRGEGKGGNDMQVSTQKMLARRTEKLMRHSTSYNCTQAAHEFF